MMKAIRKKCLITVLPALYLFTAGNDCGEDSYSFLHVLRGEMDKPVRPYYQTDVESIFMGVLSNTFKN